MAAGVRRAAGQETNPRWAGPARVIYDLPHQSIVEVLMTNCNVFEKLLHKGHVTVD